MHVMEGCKVEHASTGTWGRKEVADGQCGQEPDRMSETPACAIDRVKSSTFFAHSRWMGTADSGMIVTYERTPCYGLFTIYLAFEPKCKSRFAPSPISLSMLPGPAYTRQPNVGGVKL